MAETTIGLYEEFLESAEEIPARVTGSEGAVVVARKHLMVRNPKTAEAIRSQGEEPEIPLEIDYEVVPYSPTENSKTNQLKKLQQFMDILVQNPLVDQRRLMTHLLDALDISADVLVSQEEEQAKQMEMLQQQQSQVQAQDGAQDAMLPGMGDTIATGGMPPGVPDIPVEAQGGMAGGAGMATPEPGLM
tara:strand:- start:372 stop:938 length:567 start_codon:yes stop_codon:yes gene_type:complete